MRTVLALLLALGAAACSGGFAASDPRTGTQTAILDDGLVPPGTRVWLRLEALVDDEAAAGAPFRARVLGDVVTPDGDVLVPRGAVVEGRVVQNGPTPWLALDSLEMAGVRQRLSGQVVHAQPPGRVGRSRQEKQTAAAGLVADLPAGSRLEVRLCAPLAPLPQDDA